MGGFLRGYIWREWCERYPDALAMTGFEDSLTGTPTGQPSAKVDKATRALKAAVADVPKQENGYDCGIFIIEYLLHLLRSRSALVSLGLAPHQHWFSQASVTHRRRRFREIAACLRKQAKLRCESDVGRLLKGERLRRYIKALCERPPKRSMSDQGCEDGPPRRPSEKHFRTET